MRVEDWSLAEIVDLFLEKSRLEWLPSDSVFLLGAGNHLSKTGIVEYTEEYLKAREKLSSSISSEITILHAPVLLLNGSTDRAFLRALSELNQWLTLVECTEGPTATLRETVLAWADLLDITSTGLTQEPYPV